MQHVTLFLIITLAEDEKRSAMWIEWKAAEFLKQNSTLLIPMSHWFVELLHLMPMQMPEECL